MATSLFSGIYYEILRAWPNRWLGFFIALVMASAIAAGIAQGMDVFAAVDWARVYLLRAIAAAPGLGKGHGPLGHGWPLTEP